MGLFLLVPPILIYGFVGYLVGLNYAVNHPSDQSVWGWIKVIGWPITYAGTIGSWAWMLMRLIALRK